MKNLWNKIKGLNWLLILILFIPILFWGSIFWYVLTIPVVKTYLYVLLNI